MAKIYLSQNQIDLVIKEYIEDTLKEQRVVSLFSINALKTFMLEHMRDVYLLFPANAMDANEVIDVEAHNENIRLIKKDMQAFNITIIQMYNKIRQLNVNFDILEDYYDNQANSIRNMIASARSNLLSKDFSFTEDFSTNEFIDLDKTTAVVDTDSQLASIDKADVRDYINVGDISEEAINTSASSKTLQRHYFRGNRTSIFDYTSGDALTIVALTTKKENVTASLVIPLSEDRSLKNANHIIVKVANAVNMLGKISGGTEIDDFLPLHSTEYINPIKNVFEVTHSMGELRYIKIDLIKSTEDYDTGSFFEYDFKIYNVGLNSTNFALSSIVSSKKIQKEVDGVIVSPAATTIEVEDIIPDDTEIDYEVSVDGISWKPILPLNKGKSSNNVISFRTSGTLLIDNIKPLSNELWSDAKPRQKAGINKVYNLLQFGNSEVNYDFCQIVNDPILSAENRIIWEGKHVVKDSIVLRRGKYDFGRVSAASPLRVNIIDMDFSFKKTYQYNMPLHLRIVDERAKTDVDSVLTTRFPIISYMPMSVKVGTKPIDITGNDLNTVSIDGKPNQTARVTYYTSLKDYESIIGVPIKVIEESILFKDVITESYLDRKNFILDSIGKRVVIRNGSDLSHDNLSDEDISLLIEYEYEIDRNANASIYQTYVEVTQDTDIPIYPFTIDEVDGFGNFHMIDGVDVSFNTTYKLRQGKHQILTTQPHKTDPENYLDVNTLTNKPCNAGIGVDPSSVKSMYAFELTQRRVNLFNLANTIKATDHRSYAVSVDDEGTAVIVVNYQPEHIPQVVLDNKTTNHVRGRELYGKKAQYDILRNFTSYVSIPETFTVTFNVRTSEEEAIDGIYYRALLNRTELISTKTPSVNKVKVNFIGG